MVKVAGIKNGGFGHRNSQVKNVTASEPQYVEDCELLDEYINQTVQINQAPDDPKQKQGLLDKMGLKNRLRRKIRESKRKGRKEVVSNQKERKEINTYRRARTNSPKMSE